MSALLLLATVTAMALLAVLPGWYALAAFLALLGFLVAFLRSLDKENT